MKRGAVFLLLLAMSVSAMSGCGSGETVYQPPAAEEIPSPGFSDN